MRMRDGRVSNFEMQKLQSGDFNTSMFKSLEIEDHLHVPEAEVEPDTEPDHDTTSFMVERLKSVRTWILVELIIIDVLDLSNSLPRIKDRTVFALCMMGLSYLSTFALLFTVYKSFKNQAKWLPRIPYLMQIVIIKKYLIILEPANPVFGGKNYQMDNGIRIVCISVTVFTQVLICMFMYKSKVVQRLLPLVHFTFLYVLTISYYIILPDIVSRDIFLIVSAYIMVGWILDTIFRTIITISESLYKEEQKQHERTKFKEMFNGLQEGILVLQGTGSQKEKAFKLLYGNEIVSIIFSYIFRFTDSKKLLQLEEEEQKNLINEKVFYTYKSQEGFDDKTEQGPQSLLEIISMPPRILNQKIFLFSPSEENLIDQGDEVTDLQLALKKANILRNLPNDLIPSYKFF